MIKVNISKYWIKKKTKEEFCLKEIDVENDMLRLVSTKDSSIEVIPSSMLYSRFVVANGYSNKGTFPLEVTIQQNIIAAIANLLEAGNVENNDKGKMKCLKKAKSFINEEIKIVNEHLTLCQ